MAFAIKQSNKCWKANKSERFHITESFWFTSLNLASFGAQYEDTNEICYDKSRVYVDNISKIFEFVSKKKKSKIVGLQHKFTVLENKIFRSFLCKLHVIPVG